MSEVEFLGWCYLSIGLFAVIELLCLPLAFGQSWKRKLSEAIDELFSDLTED